MKGIIEGWLRAARDDLDGSAMQLTRIKYGVPGIYVPLQYWKRPYFPKIDDMQIAEDMQLIVGHMIMQWLRDNPGNIKEES